MVATTFANDTTDAGNTTGTLTVASHHDRPEWSRLPSGLHELVRLGDDHGSDAHGQREARSSEGHDQPGRQDGDRR